MGYYICHMAGGIEPNAFHQATNMLDDARLVGFETESLSNIQTEKFKSGTIYVITTTNTMVKKTSKWIHSQAKAMLRDDIINGVVDAQMAPMAVYQMREEYTAFKYENFRNNLKSLLNAVATSIDRMEMDSLFFGHDKSIMMNERMNKPRASPLWIESLAPIFLKQDIDEGLHNHLTPAELYASREEYQDFPLKVFRNHIYQEVDTRSKRAHRYAKKKTRSQCRV